MPDLTPTTSPAVTRGRARTRLYGPCGAGPGPCGATPTRPYPCGPRCADCGPAEQRPERNGTSPERPGTEATVYRILVTGSRDLKESDAGPLYAALLEMWHDITQLGGRMLVIHGECYPDEDEHGARPDISADWLTHLWCVENGIEDEPHPANWTARGRAAGPIRNAAMVALGARACLAAPVGRSTGTRGCMKLAAAAGIHVTDVMELAA